MLITCFFYFYFYYLLTFFITTMLNVYSCRFDSNEYIYDLISDIRQLLHLNGSVLCEKEYASGNLIYMNISI